MKALVAGLQSFAAAASLVCAMAWAGPAVAQQPKPAAQPAASKAADAKTSASETAEDILRKADEARRSTDPWKSTVLVEVTEKNKPAVVRELATYNQDNGGRIVLLFTQPKTEAGKGYLMVDRNIFYYDPSVGSWERRTVRDRIVGGMNRSDFYNPHYSDLFTGTLEGREKVDGVEAYKLLLKVKQGEEVPYPSLRLWVHPVTFHVLKDESYSLSGKLLRTGVYSDWTKEYSKGKKGDVWFPKRAQFADVETGSGTTMMVKQADIKPFDENVFTKAWLEHYSR